MPQRFAQLSDPHLSSLDAVRPRDLLGKRALGYLSWRHKRRFEHRREVLDALERDLAGTQFDQMLVTGDLTHIGLPEEFKQYFEAKDGGMQVIEPVKKLVDFQTHNLMKPAPLNRLDCVFVRNVLIYFDRKSKASVIEAVIKCLRPGGYLVVGPSEGILEVPDGLARRQPFLFQRV